MRVESDVLFPTEEFKKRWQTSGAISWCSGAQNGFAELEVNLKRFDPLKVDYWGWKQRQVGCPLHQRMDGVRFWWSFHPRLIQKPWNSDFNHDNFVCHYQVFEGRRDRAWSLMWWWILQPCIVDLTFAEFSWLKSQCRHQVERIKANDCRTHRLPASCFNQKF